MQMAISIAHQALPKVRQVLTIWSCTCAFLCGISLSASAQSAILDAPYQAWSDAVYAQKLVRNHGLVLPLQRLDTVRIATYFEDCAYPEIMRSAVDRYVPSTHLTQLPEDPGDHNTLVIGIGRDHRISGAAFRELAARMTVIAILFDRSVYQTVPQIVDAEAIVHAFVPGELNYHVCIQQLFGGTAFGVYSTQFEQLDRLGFAPPSAVGMDPAKLHREIDSLAWLAIDSGATPGLQVLVARRGKVVFHKTYGFHTYDERRPVRRDDIYDLASITKVTSGLPALMKLNGEGTFDLDATVGTYVPAMGGSNKAGLRWRDVLAHHARLMPWIPYWRSTVKKNGKYKRKVWRPKATRKFPTRVTDQLYLHRDYRHKIYKAIAESPLNEEAGFVYSGLSFYLMPEMISNLTGRPFEEYLKSEIYHKLGAYTVTYNPLRFFPQDRIVPTELDTFFRMIQIHGQVHDEGAAMMDGVSCNAGLFASAVDLAKIGQLYLNKGEYGDLRLAPPEVVQEFTRCQFCKEGNHRGLGFDKPAMDQEMIEASTSYCEKASRESFGHTGYTGTMLWVDPAKDLVFIFMSNRVYPTRLNRKLYTMKIRPAMHRVVYEAMVR
ncbi:MAG: serine hydrolase [Saprospiraceae bacterium]|nr:serine hydrolase [Saprospiraceae bacterium]